MPVEVGALGQAPAAVFAADWRLVWWNRGWAAVLGDPSAVAPDLIRGRLERNPRFAKLWREGAVGGHAEDHKTVRHPSIGDIHVDCDVLTDSDTDLKIVVFTVAAGSENESKIDLAASWERRAF
ncbi:MAG TPA: hypothetical protein VGG75_19135 [Trebonia sp.]